MRGREVGCRHHWRMIDRWIDVKLLPRAPGRAVEAPHPKIIRDRSTLECRAGELGCADVDGDAGALRDTADDPVSTRHVAGRIPDLIGHDCIVVGVRHREQRVGRYVLVVRGIEIRSRGYRCMIDGGPSDRSDRSVSQSIDEALTASESRRAGVGQSSSKQDVSDFLVEILAGGPVDVLEVERQARAAALLGEDKRLRQNKAFRDAREGLGVIAAREGFGPGARYVLSLPGTPCAPKNTMCALPETRAHMDDPGAHGETGGGE